MTTHENTPARGARKTGAVARLAQTRRLIGALSPLEGSRIEAESDTAPLPGSDALLRTDLILRVLDLRVRIALMPGKPATTLRDSRVVLEAKKLLLSNPETASVAVVADDADLTCQIVEPFDSPDITVKSPDPLRSADRYGPAATIIRRYLNHINPGWDPPPRIVTTPGLDIEWSAKQQAADRIGKLQSSRKRAPEWRAARENLDEADADLISALVVGTLDQSIEDVQTEISRAAQRRKP